MKRIIEACGFHCIKVENLGVEFGDQVVLENVNIHIHCNNLLAIIGKNGAGKSTLVRALMGNVPHSGKIEFRDTKDGHMEKLRIGYVPQNLFIDKNTPLSVYDLVASYFHLSPIFLPKKKRIYNEIKEALAVFDAEDLIDRQACNLSGGQMQRVLLSMAIMNEPHLLLLDEPVSGVDQKGMELFYNTITRLKEEFDIAVILISHDLDYVKKYADNVILLDRTVLASGTPKEVYATEEFRNIFGVEGNGNMPERSFLKEERVEAKNVGHYDASYKGGAK